MKKLMLSLLAISTLTIHAAYADETANIHIKMSGIPATNRYFLCMPNIGCLSIKAAMQRAKVYKMIHPIEVRKIYVMDTANGYRIHAQATPASCRKTVDTNQRITIQGEIVNDKNNQVQIKQLRCSISA